MRLTASKIDTFLGCRRLFKYRYVKTPPIRIPENKFFLLGNVTHSALELYHTDGGRSIKPAETMAKAFRQAAQKHKALNKAGILLDAKEMLQSYLRWDKKQSDPPKRDLEQEINFVVEGIKMSGRVDRIDHFNDSAVIIDYKTNQSVPSTDDILESVQLPLYALWLRQRGSSKIKIQYLYLRHLKRPSASRLFPATDKMLAEAAAKVRLVDHALRNGWDAHRNQLYKYCLNCDYRAYCFQDNSNVGD